MKKMFKNGMFGKALLGLSLFMVIIGGVFVLSTSSVQAKNTFIFNHDLKVGMTHSDVKELQKFFNANGYIIAKSGLGSSGQETNFFGAATLASVKSFQRANHLTADGLVGAQTRALLSGTTAIAPIFPSSSIVTTNFPAGCSSASGFSIVTGLACSSINANTFPVGCTNASGFSTVTGIACTSANANTFPAGCSSASGFSTTTGYSCLTGLPATTTPIVRGGGGGGSSSHADTIIVATAIAGVTVPVTGATPVTTVTAGTGYTGTVTWSDTPETFASATAYTATITLTPASDYTLTGVTENQFTVSGATATNSANAGVITAVFPATATTISATAIAGVTPPVTGATPVTTVTAGTGYTGTVTWSGTPSTFASATIYTATVTLTATSGYTLAGVAANQFTVAGSTTDTNPINSGVITVVFPVTNTTISTAAISGVTAPVIGATPVATLADGTGYTATIAWSGSPSTFASNTAYTATITLTAKTGYTLAGVAANFFTVAGATATNSINAGVVSAVFPVTDTTINIAAVPGVTAPVTGAAPVTTITETAQYTGTVSWAPTASTFASAEDYIASISLTPKTGYTLTGVSANFFTVAGALAYTNSPNSGSIAASFPTTATTIAATAIAGVTPPVTGATPVTTVTAGTGYTGTVAWSPSHNPFNGTQVYTATITLTAASGYTLTGVTENQFTIAGVTGIATNSANAGVITAVFPVTATTDISAAGVTGFVAPVVGATPEVFGSLTSADATKYAVTGLTWSPVANPYLGEVAYTATVTLTSTSGYKFPVGNIAVPTADVGTVNSIGTTAGGDVAGNTLSYTVLFSATAPADIAAAGVTGFTAPVTGAAPQVFGDLSAGAASYTVTGLTWAPVNDPYLGSQAYTATVTLTSASGYKFPAAGIAVPTANTGTVSAGTTAGGNVSGNTLSFTVLFPATATADIAAAGVTGFTAPVTGAAPQVFGDLSAGAATYTVTGLTWSPTDSPYLGSQAYTATVTLTSASGYKFPVAGIAVPTANTGTVSAGTTAGGDVTGNTLSFTVLFPATAPAVITTAAIPGVTAPATGVVPVTTITETTQYTGTVVWSPTSSPFASNTVYTAFITLTAKTGFTLTGVAENFFTVSGATPVTNPASSGVVTATFPVTKTSIASAAATSSSPAIGDAGSDATVAGGANYTHTSTVWSGRAGATYATGETPVAVITLAPKTGYTFYGLLAGGITVAGGTVTYEAGQGVQGGGTSVIFTVTYPQLTTEGAGGAAATGGTHTIVYTLTTGTFDATTGIVNGNWTLAGTHVADLGTVSSVVLSSGNTVATVTVSGTVGADTQNYTIAPATAAFTTGYTAPAAETVTVTAPAAPTIASVTAAEGGAGEAGLGVGDKITIVFNVATNKTTSDTYANKAAVDGVLTFEADFGTDYSGAWTNDTTLVVTSVNATGKAFAVGNTVTAKGAANIKTLDGLSAASTDASDASTGTFEPSGDVTSAAFTTTAANNNVAITLTGGTFKAGTIVATDFTFAGTDASAIALGTFNRVSDTVVAISGLTLAGGADNTVLVKTATQATQASAVAGAGSTTVTRTSDAFTATAGSDTVTITLTGGTFREGTMAATDFTFAGTDASALALGTFTRTSSTIVTITGLTLSGGVNNTVLVKTATQATQAASVAGVAAAAPLTAIGAITGTSQVGVELTAGALTPSGATATYQWKVATTVGGTYNDIGGATSSTYTVAAGDVTKFIKVEATGTGSYSGTILSAATTEVIPAVISIAAVPGVTAPVTGATPVTTITPTDEYTGTVTWSGSPVTFASATTYTAYITLTAKTGYTLTGVAANLFTVSGSTSDTNPPSSGAVTAIFPATATTISATAIAGVTPPVTDATPVTTVTAGTGYTGTVAWSGTPVTFNGGVVYTATITLTATEGYTLAGVAADQFTIAGSTSDTNSANAGVITAVFPATSIVDRTSGAFTLLTDNNRVTITLTGGTFKAGEIVADDFTFGGTDASAIAAGTFVRTSDTVVTITIATGNVGVNNTVLVKAATQATQASAVAGAGVTI